MCAGKSKKMRVLSRVHLVRDDALDDESKVSATSSSQTLTRA